MDCFGLHLCFSLIELRYYVAISVIQNVGLRGQLCGANCMLSLNPSSELPQREAVLGTLKQLPYILFVHMSKVHKILSSFT